ncbi:UbiA prenyltransferase family protein [Winogradskyella ursingii]|uniref:hypothetical protein n=1 Tax=Winogradskyella ursingii TaxID=2686079 RepID=UPI0015CE503B|nr:hypothetical protein [Winogradskyella ursingii]
MKILTRIFNFYLTSSIHVALASYALTWVTLIQFDLPYDENCLLFVFFASITGYNFVKYFGLAKFHHRSLARWLQVIQLFSLFSFVAMCYYALQLKVDTLIVVGVLGFVTFLYAIPLIPKKYIYDEHQNLRQISGIKVYVIAAVWTFSSVGLPLINNEYRFDNDVIITCIQRFCLVLVLMLPFEIRDLNYDSLKLATIPQKIGVKKTKIIGVLLLIVFFLLEYFKNELNWKSIVSTLIITLVTLLFLIGSNKKQSEYYSAFWVEGIPIIWLAILLVLS